MLLLCVSFLQCTELVVQVSLVVGDDVIPRTSLANIASLSTRIRSVVAACRRPKHAVLGWGCLACCCRVGAAPLLAELDRLFPQVDHFNRKTSPK